jgi:hypothetical protein
MIAHPARTIRARRDPAALFALDDRRMAAPVDEQHNLPSGGERFPDRVLQNFGNMIHFVFCLIFIISSNCLFRAKPFKSLYSENSGSSSNMSRMLIPEIDSNSQILSNFIIKKTSFNVLCGTRAASIRRVMRLRGTISFAPVFLIRLSSPIIFHDRYPS